MTDRDRRTVKTPPAGVLAQTAIPIEVDAARETSAAIDDPAARVAFRAELHPDVRFGVLEEHVRELRDGRIEDREAAAETRGMVKAILTISEKSAEEQRKSAKEREDRRARDLAAERRNKVLLTILSLAAAALGVHLGVG